MRTIALILLLAVLLPADELADESRTEEITNLLLGFAKAWREGDKGKLASHFADKVRAHPYAMSILFAEKAEWVEVTWPDGKRQKVEGGAAGATVRIEEQ